MARQKSRPRGTHIDYEPSSSYSKDLPFTVLTNRQIFQRLPWHWLYGFAAIVDVIPVGQEDATATETLG
jgi:hypothetical protein